MTQVIGEARGHAAAHFAAASGSGGQFACDRRSVQDYSQPDVSRAGIRLPWYWVSRSVGLGACPFARCISYHTALGNRTGGGIFGKAFWRRVRQLQGEGQTLDLKNSVVLINRR